MPPMRHGPMGPRKPKNAKATIARLFQYVGVHKVKIIIALIFVVLRLWQIWLHHICCVLLLIIISYPVAELKC